MASEIRKFYVFDEFRFDAQTHCLKHGDDHVPMPPKALEALGVLLENRGDVVTREALLDAVWSESYVDDANLSVAVSALRKTLSGYDGSKNYIQTIAKKGYRFSADVEEKVEVRDEPILVERWSREQLTVWRDDDSLSGRQKANKITRYAAIGLISVSIFVAAVAVINWRGKTNVGGIRSIAILPIKVLGETDNDKQAGLGLTEAVITKLGNLDQIIVRPVTSVLGFSESTYDPAEFGRQLNVESVLTGTLQSSGGRLAVNIRLLRSATGEQIWTGTFNESETEIFAMQDSISAEIARSLSLNLGNGEQIKKRYTQNLDAYQAYLRGRLYFDKRTKEGYKDAIDSFRLALSKDPNYAIAYSGLADVYSLQANSAGDIDNRNALYARAIDAAEKSIAIDPELADPHVSLGWIRRTHEWNWAEAENQFARAIELDANNVNALQWYALLLSNTGRHKEAIDSIEKAKAIAPLTSIVWQNSATVYFNDRQFDKALEYLEKAGDVDAEYRLRMPMFRSSFYLQMGRPNEALNDIETNLGVDGLDDDLTLFVLGAANFDLNRLDKTKAYIAALRAKGKSPRLALGLLYAHIGQKEDALGELEGLVRMHSDKVVHFGTSPRFDPLRGEPRFEEMLKRTHLTNL